MKKLNLLGITALLIIVSLTGLIGTAWAASHSMVISLPTWTGYAPLFLAQEKGFFAEHGLDVELSVTQDLGPRQQAFAAKRVDALATAHDVQVQVAAAGIPLKIVWAFDDSYGGDGILAKTDIKSIQDLKGKQVAFLRGSTSHFLLLTALESVGMTEKDIISVNMTAGDAGAAFVAGRVDAAVTWEPWLTQGSKSGGHVLVDTTDFPGVIGDSISFHGDYVAKNPEAVQAFVLAMKDAMEYWHAHTEESNQIMASSMGITLDEFVATLEGLKLMDYQDNLAFFGTSSEAGPLYDVLQNAADFYYDLKIIPAKSNVQQLVAPEFIWNAQDQ
ncbi:MAG: ABC transporter substrate-binding protein [Firmicutes bacterium]|jgi:NitT/TauT family transport system substrate-binding protein|nr:ABC transporter substrate-binding protein [Bacillota bacterium]